MTAPLTRADVTELIAAERLSREHPMRPALVVTRLGIDMAELEQLHRVLTRINSVAPAAGALAI
jgi:MarR family transcriptional regulator, organic hydroperoxide resistance regulator